MKVFIPFDNSEDLGCAGAHPPLVPFDIHAMRVVRIQTVGESTDGVAEIVLEVERDHPEYHQSHRKTRYGGAPSARTIHF